MIRLQTDEIDTQELIAGIQQDHHGAISVFLGVVRNHNIGRKVLYLDYEAYDGMAEAEMDRIRRGALEKFDLDAMAIVHRTGKLTIGEASVVVVAASAHRSAAMDACRYAIDALKKTVPIWKKEFFEGGQEWIEGPGQPMRPA
jgi:molybdopterin synthase catalytic subunit